MTLSTYFMEATYLIASILFVLALKGMSHPETARRGMFLAEGGHVRRHHRHACRHAHRHLGMDHRRPHPRLHHRRMDGRLRSHDRHAAANRALARIRRAWPLPLSASASSWFMPTTCPVVTRGALGFEVMLGALTTTGSLIAAGKLQGVIHGKPIQFRGQNVVNLLIFLAMAACFVIFWMHPRGRRRLLHHARRSPFSSASCSSFPSARPTCPSSCRC